MYPAERMEAAAQRALKARAYSSRSMESILKNQLDRLPLPGDPVVASAVNPAVAHDTAALVTSMPLHSAQKEKTCSTNKR
jgi:hypothetical protein